MLHRIALKGLFLQYTPRAPAAHPEGLLYLRELSAVTNGRCSWLNDFSDDREAPPVNTGRCVDEGKKATMAPNSERKFARMHKSDIADLARLQLHHVLTRRKLCCRDSAREDRAFRGGKFDVDVWR